MGARISLFFKISLPLLFLVMLDVYPLSRGVVDSLREARIAAEQGQPQERARALQRVLAIEPWRVTLWEPAGQAALEAGQAPEAIAALQQAAQAGALSAAGRIRLGDAFLLQGEPHAAEAAWQQVLTHPAAPLALEQQRAVYERLVRVQREARETTRLLQTLRAWRAADPQNPQVAYLLGLQLSAASPAEALPYLLEAAQKDASYTSAVQMVRRGLGLAAAAEDPAYGWLMIGRSLGSIGQWQLALQAFQRAVDASPGYAEAWAFLGEARFHLDGSGKKELDRASELDAGSPVVRALLALYWRRHGEPAKALPFLQAIAAQEPLEPTWQVEIGNTLVEIGDLEAAHQAYRKVLELAPTNAGYWLDLANFSAQYNVDLPGVGLPAARQALLLAPDDPRALDTMGWVMALLGDGASAERFLQRALTVDATHALASLHLGQLYLTSDAERAYPYLRRALALDRDGSVGTIARRLLLRYYGEKD